VKIDHSMWLQVKITQKGCIPGILDMSDYMELPGNQQSSSRLDSYQEDRKEWIQRVKINVNGMENLYKKEEEARAHHTSLQVHASAAVHFKDWRAQTPGKVVSIK
jgi:hypothetical protein